MIILIPIEFYDSYKYQVFDSQFFELCIFQKNVDRVDYLCILCHEIYLISRVFICFETEIVLQYRHSLRALFIILIHY